MCQFVEESQSNGLGFFEYDVQALSTDERSMSINTGFKETTDGNAYFFNHSCGVFADDVEIEGIHTSAFGHRKIISHLITKDGLHCQFHPELSEECGFNLVKEFLNLGKDNG